jgi:hypothetical protein
MPVEDGEQPARYMLSSGFRLNESVHAIRVSCVAHRPKTLSYRKASVTSEHTHLSGRRHCPLGRELTVLFHGCVGADECNSRSSVISIPISGSAAEPEAFHLYQGSIHALFLGPARRRIKSAAYDKKVNKDHSPARNT